MRKLILAASALGMLTAGGVATASAQYLGPAYVYEGRNVYMDPGPTVVYESPRYVAPVPMVGPSYSYQPNYTDPWYLPSDQAIINQQRANSRSSR
ncbi:MAG: hypothetical protein K0S00_4106 [Xanthobacteraceae bacterium]|jgi:hypothetical protein|nr:hypothetical protein [Xanthobacteraceae bacterium]